MEHGFSLKGETLKAASLPVGVVGGETSARERVGTLLEAFKRVRGVRGVRGVLEAPGRLRP